uniref:FLYWCH-type domain-containing protein n=1 Tax=Parastrongyloides trichosuri TaxID=131310 RepID=A0A0N4ZYR2_PARTI
MSSPNNINSLLNGSYTSLTTNDILNFIAQPNGEGSKFLFSNMDSDNNVSTSESVSLPRKYKTVKNFSTWDEGLEYVKNIKVLRCRSQYPGKLIKTFQYVCKIKDCKYNALLKMNKDGTTAILQTTSEYHGHTVDDLEVQSSIKKQKLEMCDKALEIAINLKNSGMDYKKIYSTLEEEDRNGKVIFKGDISQLRNKVKRNIIKNTLPNQNITLNSSLSLFDSSNDNTQTNDSSYNSLVSLDKTILNTIPTRSDTDQNLFNFSNCDLSLNNISLNPLLDTTGSSINLEKTHYDSALIKRNYEKTIEEFGNDPCIQVFETWEKGEEYVKNLKILRCKSTYPKRIHRRAHQFVCRIRDCNYSAMLKTTDREPACILRGNFPNHSHTFEGTEGQNMIKKRKVDICSKAVEMANNLKKSGLSFAEIEKRLKIEDEKGNVVYKGCINHLKSRLYKINNSKANVEKPTETYVDLLRIFNPPTLLHEKEPPVFSSNNSTILEYEKNDDKEEFLNDNVDLFDILPEPSFDILTNIYKNDPTKKVFKSWSEAESYVEDYKIFELKDKELTNPKKIYKYNCKVEGCKYEMIIKSVVDDGVCILKCNSPNHEHNAANIDDFNTNKKDNHYKSSIDMLFGDTCNLESTISDEAKDKNKLQIRVGLNESNQIKTEELPFETLAVKYLSGELFEAEDSVKKDVDQEPSLSLEEDSSNNLISFLKSLQTCSTKENSIPYSNNLSTKENEGKVKSRKMNRSSFEHDKTFDSWEEGEEYIKSLKILRCKSKYPKRQRRSHQYVCRMRDCRFSIMLKMSENEKCVLRANSVNHEHTDEDLKNINSIKVRKLEICDKAFEIAKKHRIDGMSIKQIHKVLEQEKLMNSSICYNLNESQLRNKFNTAGFVKEHKKGNTKINDTLSFIHNLNSLTAIPPVNTTVEGIKTELTVMPNDNNVQESCLNNQNDFNRIFEDMFKFNASKTVT